MSSDDSIFTVTFGCIIPVKNDNCWWFTSECIHKVKIGVVQSIGLNLCSKQSWTISFVKH